MSLLDKVRRIIGLDGHSDWYYRTQHADQYFEAWAKRFAVADSLRYYTGHQWRNIGNYANYSPYVINKVYAAIKVKRPALLFDRPQFHLTPRPSPDFVEYDFELAAKRVALKQDVLNSWVWERKNHFSEEVKQSIVDAFFGFGIIETGYSADWGENPDAQKPAYDDSNDPDKVTTKPVELPTSERTYIKRIPFPQFRVGGVDSCILERNNWFGYWEFVDRRDLENAADHEYDSESFSGNRSTELDSMQSVFGATGNLGEIQEYLKKGDLVKVWKIWDMRSKIMLKWVESNDQIIFAKYFDKPGISRLSFDENTYGFYPIPPVSQWLDSQDEINECAEQLRVHRRRANRKYIVRMDEDDTELQKMLNGPDGTYMKTESAVDSVIFPVPQAPMDSSNAQSFLASNDNFNVVSQTGSELRGQADRETATAAAISAQTAKITDSEPKFIVANYLCGIAEDILDRLAISVIPFWVKRSQQDQQLGTSVIQPPKFEKISGADIDGDDCEINVKISSISPIDDAAELQTFTTFMGILNSNPEFALSPLLIREIATRCNYTNEAVIEELQKIATLKLMGLQQNGGQNGGDPSQQGAVGAQQAPNNAIQNQGAPDSAAIQSQMEGQVG